jgi:hypothetical protein
MVPLPGAAGVCVSVMARAVKLGSPFHAAHRLKHFARSARSQHVAARLRHPRKDRRNLRGGLARGKDHFGHSGPQCAVMIQLGKSKVLKRKIAQPSQRFLNAGTAFPYFRQQIFKAHAIHQSPSFFAIVAA